MRALASLLLVCLGQALIGCSSGPADPTATAPAEATPASTASPAPPATPTPEPTATPRGPLVIHPGTLDAIPPTGSCEDVILLAATGFAPRAMVEFHLWTGMNDTLVAGSAFASDEGETVLPVSLADLVGEDCHPGSEFVFEARVLGDTTRTAWPRATFAAQQIGQFWLEPDHGPCGMIETTVHGEGLASGGSLRLSSGDAGAFAHNFVSLGTTDVGEDGTFAATVTLPVSCQSAAIAVYGSSYSGIAAARWKAIYTVVAP